MKCQAQETKPTYSCFKDSKYLCHEILANGFGRDVLASTADSAQFWRIGENWPCYSARPFHALFARISCNTFLESLKHTDQT